MWTTSLLLFLALQAPQEPEAKVLMIGIDGVRPDCLVAADTPTIDKLSAAGVLKLNARTTSITSSGPAWSSFLTGARMSMHGVRDNSFEGLRLDDWPTWLAQIEKARPELFTASIAQWDPIHTFLFPAQSVDMSTTAADGAAVAAGAIKLLRDKKKDADAVFLHFDDVDHAGHGFGYGVDIPEYIAAIEKVDSEIAEVLQAVRGRDSFANENWLILVGTDHGGFEKGHGQDIPECRTVFMLSSTLGGKASKAPQWRDSAEIHDFAPTALTHFGLAGTSIPVHRFESDWWRQRQQLLHQRATGQTSSQLIFLGDSITHSWEYDGSSIWQAQYEKHAAVNLGISGDRTEHLLWRLRHSPLTNLNPKAAVIMIGTNNTGQFKQNPRHTFLGIQSIVAELRFQLPETQLLLLGIFPRDAKADGVYRKINRQVNDLLQPWADEQTGLHYLNINPHFLTENATLAPEIMPDLLHPNKRGYQIWADAIASLLDELLH